MVKAVMLRWGSLLGGPCAPNDSSTSSFVFHPGETSFCDYFLKFTTEKLRKSRAKHRWGEVHLRPEPGGWPTNGENTPPLSPGKAGVPLRPWREKATGRKDGDWSRYCSAQARPWGRTQRREPCPRTPGQAPVPLPDSGTEVLAPAPAPAENP